MNREFIKLTLSSDKPIFIRVKEIRNFYPEFTTEGSFTLVVMYYKKENGGQHFHTVKEIPAEIMRLIDQITD